MRHILFSLMLAITTICQASPNTTTYSCNCDLPAPQNLKAVEVGTTYATLRWDAVVGAVGYQISLLDTLGNLIHTALTTETTIFEEDLESGLAYEYRVAAVCLGGGVSTWFSIVAIKPVVVDLVVSLEKPKGGGAVICQQDIAPSAECVFNVQNNQYIIGEVKRKSTGQIVLFKIKFNISEFNLLKCTLNKISENYYSENAFNRPKIFSNNNKIEDQNIIYAYISIGNNKKLCYLYFDQPNPLTNTFKLKVNQPIFEDLQITIKLGLDPNNFDDLSSERSESYSKSIKVFPNIVNQKADILVTDNNLLPLTGCIYKTDGSRLSTFNILDLETSMDFSYLKPGIYFFSLQNATFKEIVKIIKTE